MIQPNDMDFLLAYKFSSFFNDKDKKDKTSMIFINKKTIDIVYIYDDYDTMRKSAYRFFVAVVSKNTIYKVSGHLDIDSAYKELKTLMNVLQGLPISLDFENLVV